MWQPNLNVSTPELLAELDAQAGEMVGPTLTQIVAWGLAQQTAEELAGKVAEAERDAERITAEREQAGADAETARREYGRAHEASRKAPVGSHSEAKRAEAEAKWRSARMRSVTQATSPEKASARAAKLAAHLAALRSVELPDPDALPGLREWLTGGGASGGAE